MTGNMKHNRHLNLDFETMKISNHLTSMDGPLRLFNETQTELKTIKK